MLASELGSHESHQLKAAAIPTALLCLQAEYDGNAYKTNPVQSAFTRRREIFVGKFESSLQADYCPDWRCATASKLRSVRCSGMLQRGLCV